MRIGVLTSSRADYGIYLPLLKKLRADDFFELSIIAFGTHLSTYHGQTVRQIEKDGFDVKYRIESLLLTDTAESISTSMGLTTIKFASFWNQHSSNFDLIFCLGDRFEMFSAIIAGIAFNIPFAHLHGGETTLGAIDNVFRHSISLAAKYHFVATGVFAERVTSMLSSTKGVHCVGALSLDSLDEIELLSIADFRENWGINLSKATILTTFHPETIRPEENIFYAKEIVRVIKGNQNYQFLITLPNADTAGSDIRKVFETELKNLQNVFLIENLGSQSYFTAMKYCAFLLGNTSSGIIEAASFGKYVINIGDRQKGRIHGDNVIQAKIEATEIMDIIRRLERNIVFTGQNIYHKRNTADQIIKILKHSNFNAI